MPDPDWTRLRPITKKRVGKTLLGVGVLCVVMVASAPLLADYWYLWIAITIVGTAGLIFWAARTAGPTAFICGECGHRWTLPARRFVFAMHAVSKHEGRYYQWHQLECPGCNQGVEAYEALDEPDG